MQAFGYKVSRPWQILFLAALGFLLAYMVWPVFTNPREKKTREYVRFVEIGKRVASYLGTRSGKTPAGLEEFVALGVLSKSDSEFLADKRVQYSPPSSTNSSDRWILLAYPYSQGWQYVVFMNGDYHMQPVGSGEP
jgi:hypothetical protein